VRFSAFGVWFREDWVFSLCQPNALDVVWKPLSRNSAQITPTSHQVWFRTRGSKVPRGWYLFIIRHKGHNPAVTGCLKSGTWGYPQGRPMYPLRNRLRVIHVNRPRQLTLELQNVSRPLAIYRLLLFRLPGCYAFRRITKRLNSLDQFLPLSLTDRWRYYNQLQNSQCGLKPLVSYNRWQNLVEAPLLFDIPLSTDACNKRFVIQTIPHISPVKPDEYVVLLRPGVHLATWGLSLLQQFLPVLCMHDSPVLLFGDEDIISRTGERHSPRFKPSWNLELFCSDPNFSNHWIVQGECWNSFLDNKTLDVKNWWSLQYGLLFYINGLMLSTRIKHLPMVLAHTETPAPSGSISALQSQFKQSLGINSPSIFAVQYGLRLEWACPKQVLISVIIPTRDHLPLLQSCLYSIEAFPAGCDLEIIVVDNGSINSTTLDFLQDFNCIPSHQVIRDDGPFNYSRLNNIAVSFSRGNVLLLLNNDVEFLCPNWGIELAGNALRSEIGCVGVQLLYPDTTIQHGGVILGIGGMASHAHRSFTSDAPGYNGRLQLAQEMSAVTAACLAISSENWKQLGGLDEEKLWVNYNDVDLCLRAGAAGLRNLYLPQVKAIHHESKTRGRPEGAAYRQWRREWDVMKQRWGALLDCDPAYSPWLTLEDEGFGLSLRQKPLALR